MALLNVIALHGCIYGSIISIFFFNMRNKAAYIEHKSQNKIEP
jgi:hypothetical protein